MLYPKGGRSFLMLRVVVLLLVLSEMAVSTPAAAECSELMRLRKAASASWQEAINAPSSERCGALERASSMMAATVEYATSHREACSVSSELSDRLEQGNREAADASRNVCAGRPMRPYPPDRIDRPKR